MRVTVWKHIVQWSMTQLYKLIYKNNIKIKYLCPQIKRLCAAPNFCPCFFFLSLFISVAMLGRVLSTLLLTSKIIPRNARQTAISSPIKICHARQVGCNPPWLARWVLLFDGRKYLSISKVKINETDQVSENSLHILHITLLQRLYPAYL